MPTKCGNNYCICHRRIEERRMWRQTAAALAERNNTKAVKRICILDNLALTTRLAALNSFAGQCFGYWLGVLKKLARFEVFRNLSRLRQHWNWFVHIADNYMIHKMQVGSMGHPCPVVVLFLRDSVCFDKQMTGSDIFWIRKSFKTEKV